MNHKEVRANLGEYLEGDLDLGRRALVDAHLDGCTECRSEVNELVATVALVRGLPDPEPPGDLTANVMRRVRAGEADASQLARVGSWISDLLWPGLALPTAAMVAALVVAVYSGRVSIPLLTEPEPAAAVIADARQPLRIVVGRSDPTPARSAATSGVLALAPGAIARGELVALEPRLPEAASPDAALEQRVVDRRSRLIRSYVGDVRRQLQAGSEFPRTADDWLVVLSRSPARFAKAQSGLTEAEQELWARQLARRAVERGLAEDVAGTLSRSSSQDVRAFASRFRSEVESYTATR